MAEGLPSKQPFHDDSTKSIEELKEQALIMIENECLALEKDLENKKRENASLRLMIQKQDENISKMQQELEQTKMKIHREIMAKADCESKLKMMNEACQTLEKNLSQYSKGVNEILPRMDELRKMLKQKQTAVKENESQCSWIQDNYEKVLSFVTRTAEEMEKVMRREEREFDGIICHMKSQIKEKREQTFLLEEQYRQIDARCKETETMIQMLIPQKNELSNVISGLRSEIARQKESFENEKAALKEALQEEASRKAELIEKIGKMDNMIDETNVDIRVKENEAKELDIRLKQLISECDELDKANRSDVEEINKLKQEVEEKERTFASLKEIDEENKLLIKRREDLQKRHAELEEKIIEKRKTEDTNRSQIAQINKFIEEAEKEKEKLERQKLELEERIKNKKSELIENEQQHKENCSKHKKEYNKLCKKQEQLKKQASEKEELFAKLKKQQEGLDSQLSCLKDQYYVSKKKHEDSFTELVNYTHEKESVVKHLREEITMLDESKKEAAKAARKALEDTQAHQEITKRINQLEEQLERLAQEDESALELLHKENAKKIQEKQKNLEELRAQKEIDFRRMEQTKANAAIELRENKKFIEELDNQKRLTESEIKKTTANLEKCDLLIKKLEEKLDTVARVVMNSQSVAENSSQTSNLLSTPKLGFSKPQPKVFNSPDSDSSSGVSINPDDVASKTLMTKGNTKKSYSKKKTPFMPPKKKNKYNDDDDDGWAF